MNLVTYMHRNGMKAIRKLVNFFMKNKFNLKITGDFSCGKCSNISKNVAIILAVTIFTMVIIIIFYYYFNFKILLAYASKLIERSSNNDVDLRSYDIC